MKIARTVYNFFAQLRLGLANWACFLTVVNDAFAWGLLILNLFPKINICLSLSLYFGGFGQRLSNLR